VSLNKSIHSVALTVTNRTRCSDKPPLTKTKYTYRAERPPTIMLKFTSPQFTLHTPSFGDQSLWRRTRSFGNQNRWRNYEARGSRCYVSGNSTRPKGRPKSTVNIFAIGACYETFSDQEPGGASQVVSQHQHYFDQALQISQQYEEKRNVDHISCLLAQCFYLLATCQTDQ
jgi:hypothetical protein